MKKIYIIPSMTTITVNVTSPLLEGSLKISGEEKSEVADGGFTKGQGSWGDVWGSNDDEE